MLTPSRRTTVGPLCRSTVYNTGGVFSTAISAVLQGGVLARIYYHFDARGATSFLLDEAPPEGPSRPIPFDAYSSAKYNPLLGLVWARFEAEEVLAPWDAFSMVRAREHRQDL